MINNRCHTQRKNSLSQRNLNLEQPVTRILWPALNHCTTRLHFLMMDKIYLSSGASHFQDFKMVKIGRHNCLHHTPLILIVWWLHGCKKRCRAWHMNSRVNPSFSPTFHDAYLLLDKQSELASWGQRNFKLCSFVTKKIPLAIWTTTKNKKCLFCTRMVFSK